jgi:phosphonate metabolism protein PhnN/1,5-bisphosphokinase (PRPP-forming)
MLVLVVGPSGAGKDTLMGRARQVLAGDPRLRFVRRTITRPPDPDGENHVSVSFEEFTAMDHALMWEAHGLRYGIPADIEDDLARGMTVVANVSRAVIAAACARFPARVVEITAPPSILAVRLAVRGREDAADVARRLSRAVALPPGVVVRRVMNDGPLEEGVARFLAALDD